MPWSGGGSWLPGYLRVAVVGRGGADWSMLWILRGFTAEARGRFIGVVFSGPPRRYNNVMTGGIETRSMLRACPRFLLGKTIRPTRGGELGCRVFSREERVGGAQGVAGQEKELTRARGPAERRANGAWQMARSKAVLHGTSAFIRDDTVLIPTSTTMRARSEVAARILPDMNRS